MEGCGSSLLFLVWALVGWGLGVKGRGGGQERGSV